MTATRVLRSLVLVVAVALLAACGSEPTSGPVLTFELGDDIVEVETVDGHAHAGETIQRVVMIGDSITKGSVGLLEQRFADLGLETTIVAENGKRMVVSSTDNPSGADLTAFLSSAEGQNFAEEVWVVALGTNDAGQYGSADEIAAAVNDVLAGVPADAALVWVDTYVASRTDDTSDLNAVIHERVRRRGNAAIAPWSAVAADDGVLTGDAVHPTSEGAEVFASLVADSVAAFIGR